MSWHNTAKSVGSGVEVNAAIVRWRTVPLPGEISAARGRESGSAGRSNASGDGREVSRGQISDQRAGGCETPALNCDTGNLDGVKDRTDTMDRPGHPPTALNPAFMVGEPDMGMGAGQRQRAHALAPLFRKERRRTFVALG